MRTPWQISLDSVLEEPVAFDFELPLSVQGLDREPLVEISPVRLSGEVARIEGGFSFEARVGYAGKLECSRCLAAYPFETDESFTLLLYRRPSARPAERELAKDDLDVYYYEAPELSVLPIAEERIQMAIPMKPLCREECRGLCAHCGADLNLARCACAEDTFDPRWDALRELTRRPRS